MNNVLETYLGQLRGMHASGGGAGETSGFGALANLFNAAGQALKANHSIGRPGHYLKVIQP